MDSQSSVLSATIRYSKGSVPGPLLFNLYTTSLSTVFSEPCVHLHRYADDVQLFICVTSFEFLVNISFLRNIRTEVYFWMSVNLLKFNPFKTDFMLFGLLKQLFKAQAALSIGLVKCGSWFCKWGLSLSTIWQLILLRQSRTRAHMV